MFLKKKFQRGNQLVQKKKVNKEGRISNNYELVLIMNVMKVINNYEYCEYSYYEYYVNIKTMSHIWV